MPEKMSGVLLLVALRPFELLDSIGPSILQWLFTLRRHPPTSGGVEKSSIYRLQLGFADESRV